MTATKISITIPISHGAASDRLRSFRLVSAARMRGTRMQAQIKYGIATNIVIPHTPSEPAAIPAIADAGGRNRVQVKKL
jgi:hypothetical protein